MERIPASEATETRSGAGEPAAVRELGDRWRLEKLVGRGGQAEVWRAHDRLLDQTVALKVFGSELSAAQRERLRREVMLGRDLRHPHLVRVLEPAEVRGRLAVVMEWLPGGSLQGEAEGGPFAVERMVEVAGQVLEALAFLHSRRVVHRDVKPSNLLLDGEGRVRLADLGLARSLEGDVTVTRTATAIGTPAYMSPEQLRGDEPSPASDLYSLGVTLWVLLTGRHPFTASSEFDLADAHLNRRPPDVRRSRPDCPRWLARFLSRLLEKKVRDRWPEAAPALEALRRRRALASPRWWRRAAAVVAVTSLVAGVLGVWVAGRGRPVDHVQGAGDDMVAFDARGRELWRVPLGGEVAEPGLADLTGDGEDEAVGIVFDRDAKPEVASMVVLDRLGNAVSRWPVLPEMMWAPQYAATVKAGARSWAAADLDGDGRREVAWIALHPDTRPSILGAAGAAFRGRAATLFDHPGHLGSLLPWDADGDGDDELLATVINNALEYHVGVALVDLEREPVTGMAVTALAPDAAPGRRLPEYTRRSPLRFYTLVGENDIMTLEVEARADTIEVTDGAGVVITLDPSGAPIGSPLAGGDGARRREMWDDADRLVREVEADVADGLEKVRGFAPRYPDVLAEDAMDTGVAVLLATALAQGGAPGDGIEVLEEALERHPASRALAARRARLAWLAGRSDDAQREWRRFLSTQRMEGGQYSGIFADAMRAAAMDGRTDRAEELFAEISREKLRYTFGGRFAAEGLEAFFAGRWDHPALDVGSPTVMLPELDALRLWARLERDADPAAVEREAETLESRILAVDSARLVRARALLAQGRADRALGFAETVLADLEGPARIEIESAILVPVAEWLVGRCHEALGDPERAAEHLARARALAPRTYFGQPSP